MFDENRKTGIISLKTDIASKLTVSNPKVRDMAIDVLVQKELERRKEMVISNIENLYRDYYE